MVLAALFRIMTKLAPLVPRRLGLRLFALPAPIVGRLAPSRHAVRDNMRHVVGPDAADDELRSLVVDAYRHQLMNYYDLFLGPSMSREDIEQHVRVVDKQALASALSSPEGCVVVAPHFGNLDLSSRGFTAVGAEGLAVVERLASDPLFEVVCELRHQGGFELVPADKAAMAIMRTLRRGGAVFLAADRDTTDSSITIDFFGSPARLPDGYAQVVRRTGARMILAGVMRRSDGDLQIETTLLPRPTLSDEPESDIREIMRVALDYFEDHIRRSPGQWVLFERVWEDPSSNRDDLDARDVATD